MESPDGGGGGEQMSAHPTPGASPQTSGPPSHPSTTSNNSDGGNVPCLKVRSTPLKQSPGYQVDLVVQLVWVSGEPPQQITSLALNSSYGLVVFGNSSGLVVVDYVQKTVVLNLGTAELYGPTDPHQRQPRSPRKSRQPSGGKKSNPQEINPRQFVSLLLQRQGAAVTVLMTVLPPCSGCWYSSCTPVGPTLTLQTRMPTLLYSPPHE
ncbi:hypothetical protein fugu_017444 [Takifugu bimaculatus]|uniref:Lethal giant larvae homologue 2 domain-containing protein n=1 Tax=Takifugu bimaculatus TaxID=433685 RepID=A0A4Z2BQZ4_9TELE|nr:hypothetical protein fugu_017444 [Takifugu bimaculatus]